LIEVVYKPATEAEYAKLIEPVFGPVAGFVARIHATIYESVRGGHVVINNDLVELTARQHSH